MTLQEVFKALSEGKKIRRHGWDETLYIRLTNEGIFNDSGKVYSFSITNFTDWELFQEPKKTKTLYEWIVKSNQLDYWSFSHSLYTEAQAKFFWKGCGYRKTGSSFEVEDV